MCLWLFIAWMQGPYVWTIFEILVANDIIITYYAIHKALVILI